MPTIEQGRSQASRGFTLIEMSIVLVIIGLIVGGILKGQEIVNAAREKQVITQLNSIRTAQNTYIDRHGQYPGDDTRAAFVNFAVKAGNGNRFVGGTVAASGAIAAQLVAQSVDPQVEEGAYWVGLVAEGLIGNAVAPIVNTKVTDFGIDHASFLPNTAFPNTGLGVTAGIHSGDTGRDAASDLAKGTNWIGIWSNLYTNNGGVSLRQAGHIDVALDDGIPSTGLVRGDDNKCNTKKGTGYDGGAALAAGTDLTSPTCVILINMGPNQ